VKGLRIVQAFPFPEYQLQLCEDVTKHIADRWAQESQDNNNRKSNQNKD
jgi:hypothetical protein